MDHMRDLAQRLPRIQPSPLYAQLVKLFQENIRQKVWHQGEALPSEADVARQYGVSIGTARKALEILEQTGWVVRRQGRGTFVSNRKALPANRLSRVVMTNDSDVSDQCAMSLLEQSVCLPTVEEAAALKLTHGEKVMRVKRMFCKGAAGVMMEDILLRSDEFKNLDEETGRMPDAFSSILAECNRDIGRCVENISAVAAPERVAQALGTGNGAPVLYCRRVVEDDEGVPLGVFDRWIVTQDVVCSMVVN